MRAFVIRVSTRIVERVLVHMLHDLQDAPVAADVRESYVRLPGIQPTLRPRGSAVRIKTRMNEQAIGEHGNLRRVLNFSRHGPRPPLAISRGRYRIKRQLGGRVHRQRLPGNAPGGTRFPEFSDADSGPYDLGDGPARRAPIGIGTTAGACFLRVPAVVCDERRGGLQNLEVGGGARKLEVGGGTRRGYRQPDNQEGNRIEFLIESLSLKVKCCGAMAHVILSPRRQWFKSRRRRKDSSSSSRSNGRSTTKRESSHGAAGLRLAFDLWCRSSDALNWTLRLCRDGQKLSLNELHEVTCRSPTRSKHYDEGRTIMEHFISNLLSRYEKGTLTRRQAIRGLAVLAATGGAASALRVKTTPRYEATASTMCRFASATWSVPSSFTRTYSA